MSSYVFKGRITGQTGVNDVEPGNVRLSTHAASARVL